MARRVNPTVLLYVVIMLVLSFGISASAQLAHHTPDELTTDVQRPIGSTPDAAIAVGEAQLGKPYMFGVDGPNAFSCSGLMRYILRTTGVDRDAPWVPEQYLGRYTPVDSANLQPGDIVIYPGWATMYVGNGMLLNANEVTRSVTHTPLTAAGVPLGAVRPPYWGSQGEPLQQATHPLDDTTGQVPTEPLPDEPVHMRDPPVSEQYTTEQYNDPMLYEATDPLVTDQRASDPLLY
jgi:hypothetical protein